MLNKAVKIIWITGFLSGASGVILGALGAHFWRDLLIRNNRIETFHTAVLYHMIHTLMLILAGVLVKLRPSVPSLTAAVLFALGIIFFSGSLYFLSLSGKPAFGILTPAGGIFLIAAWLLLAYHTFRSQ